MRPLTLLKRLEKIKAEYGAEGARRKTDLLRQLARRRMTSAAQVERLHEVLCFLRAYPDDRQILRQVESMLETFDGRSDLKRHREELEDSGIAGTDLYFSFFYFTALWLAEHCPESLEVDWPEFVHESRLEEILQFLVPYSETLGLDMLPYKGKRWLHELKGQNETDASFLIGRIPRLRADAFAQEMLYESLDVPLRLRPGRKVPSRSRAKDRRASIVYQRQPLDRRRPVLTDALDAVQLSAQPVEGARSQELIDLMRAAMAVRHRDLYTFSHVNPEDVFLVDAGEGLQFVGFGTTPLRRLMLETLYGFITLKNGVPIGYVLTSSMFGSTEIAYNVFDSFRGGEAGHIFGRVLALARQMLGATAFSIDPYQLGHNNAEGLESGAWWFYYKLGFRPHDSYVKQLLREELARMNRDPEHRSSTEVLNELSSAHMFWYVGRPRSDVMGRVEIGRIGLAVNRMMARRFGVEREEGIDTCTREAQQLVGQRSLSRFSDDERRAFERWSPLVLLLPGVKRWSAEERRDLGRIMRAKGSRRETEFLRRFHAHPRLHSALIDLARSRTAR